MRFQFKSNLNQSRPRTRWGVQPLWRAPVRGSLAVGCWKKPFRWHGNPRVCGSLSSSRTSQRWPELRRSRWPRLCGGRPASVQGQAEPAAARREQRPRRGGGPRRGPASGALREPAARRGLSQPCALWMGAGGGAGSSSLSSR